MINAPFGDCKTTALHLADGIQPFGAMLIIDRHGRICAVSANCEAWLGEAPHALLGREAGSMLPANVIEAPNTLVPDGVYGPCLQPLVYKGQELMAATHRSGELTIVEIESCPESTLRTGWEEAMLTRGLSELGATETTEAAAEALMQLVAEITGYGRVMLYQFLPDWHGKVVAELCQPGIDGFLGLHFPAGDIPPNARSLYQAMRQRIIADVCADPVPVLAQETGMTVDLAHSQLRAVHPVHIQYLKNMGAKASFSVSLVVDDRLWGMIACHHPVPRQISFGKRQLCEQLAGMASIHMRDLQRLELEQARHAHQEVRTHVKLELQVMAGGEQDIATQLTRIRTAFAASGAWAWLGGRSHFSGDVPDETGLGVLKTWLENLDHHRVAARDRIDPALEKHPALVRFASGLLYVPLIEQDFLLLMRAEQVQNVDWAGKPPGAVAGEDTEIELTPRRSFQLWREQTHGHAVPWQETDLEAAAYLRDMLTEHVERMRLERMALTDALTGLANRAMFERKIQDAIRISLRDNTISAVHLIDLDRFKAVNDSYGHAVGDTLLIQVAQRLREHVRDRDVVARLGGDEFAIVQFRVASREEVDAVAARVLEALSRLYVVQGHTLEIGASIGVALCPQHAVEQQELLERADLALYKVKHEGRSNFRLFDSSLLPEGARPQSLRNKLLDAIENNALHFVYQPILHAGTRRLWGLEAFARWRHPERGLLQGTELLTLAEQHGLLEPFAHWGLRQAVQQAHQWQRKGHTLVPLSVRLTAQQFRSVDLAARCAELAAQYGMALDWLRLDVDDSILQSGVSTVAARLDALAGQGVLAQIDHFGCSLLPLAELANIRINCLKIDGSMLQRQAGKDNVLAAILSSIAKALHAPVVATRIESEAMLAEAVGCGAELVQGYAVAPLLEADEVPAWLSQGAEPKR